MGHSEAVSGLCSISKAILMFEREMIPPNLHFYKPRSEITALKDGRIKASSGYLKSNIWKLKNCFEVGNQKIVRK